jgi:hypothetical protein
MLHRDVGDTVRPNDTNYVVPSHPATYPQRGQHRAALGNTIRLEEAVYEEEEEEEEDDEEIMYSDYSDGDQVAYAEGTDADVTVTSRKRDYEHGGHDPRSQAETENDASKTPPKRTRVEGKYSPLTAAEVSAARISKRGSEEAALSSVAAGKRPRVADGEAAVEGGDEGSTTPDTGNAPTTISIGSESSSIRVQTTQATTGREGVGVET